MYGKSFPEEWSRVRPRVRLAVIPPKAVSQSINGRLYRTAVGEEALLAGLPKELFRRFPLHVRHTHQRLNAVVLEIRADRAEEFRRFLDWAGFPNEAVTRVYPLLKESVPLIGVPNLWNAGFTGKGVRVAILDTGIDRQHPDLKNRIAAYRNFTRFKSEDTVGHGTHCAGIICGGGKVYRGVAPGVELFCGKVIDEQGGESDDVVAGMSWAASQGAKIISLSLGGPGNPADLMCRECDALAKDGVTVVIAAGNEGPAAETIGSPGCAVSAITVGSVDKNGQLAFYSSRGPVRMGRKRIHKPDLLAPGGGVVTEGKAKCPYTTGIVSAKSAKMPTDACDRGKGYTRMSGTSMAAPHIAGLVALFLEMDPQLKGPEAIKKRLRKNCRSLGLTADEQGYGLIKMDNDG